MESFLKYLRGGAAAGNQRAPVTIAASACEDGGGGGGDVDDDASFFDLEFAVPGDESAASDAEEERVEFNFAVAGDCEDAAAEVVAVDAVVAAPAGGESKKKDGDGGAESEAEAEVAAPPPASLPPRPAATKFRVLLLKLRKPKQNVPAVDGNGGGAAPAAKSTATNRFLIKFRVDEAPLVSLFTRDNSSRTSDADKPSPAAAAAQQSQDASTITAEERRFAKEVLLKYLNKIKPLYVKVSRRYGDRLRFSAGDGDETDAEPDHSSAAPLSSQPTTPSSATASAAPPQQPQPVVVACGVRAPRASVPAGLKQVCKRLGKSRSASSAVAAAPSPTPATTPATPVVAAHQRRDDSLLQVQDGIQSAIAHCKRSFNASKGCESPLLRSMTVAGDARAGDNTDGGDGA